MSLLQEKHLKDYEIPSRQIKKIFLIFQIEDDCIDIVSQLFIEKNTHKDTFFILDGIDLEIDYIKLNNRNLTKHDYEITPKNLILNKVPQNSFELEIKNRIYPQNNTSLEGIYLSNGILCSQCEAEGFRRITYFLDRPDALSLFRCKIIADKSKHPTLLSNGNLIESGALDKNRHYVIWDDPYKKPAYLFALVAGNLERICDTFITKSNKEVALTIYSEKDKIHLCHYAMQCLKKSMKWDEVYYDLEYDLDNFNIVAIEDFNAGAMENKGLNVFNAQYIFADIETASDKDYENVDAVIAHEYFHNWTGNRVTLKNWFQLCLKEGLTVFREHQYMQDQLEKSVKRMEDIQFLRQHQYLEDAGVMAHPVQPKSYKEINNFYTTTVYEKGAEIFRLLEVILGKQQLKEIIQSFLKEFDAQAASMEDFFTIVAQKSDLNIQSFRRWIDQAGTPHVSYSINYNEQKSCYQLSLKQTITNPHIKEEALPFVIPLDFRVYDQHNPKHIFKSNEHTEKQPLFDQKTMLFDLPQPLNERSILSFNRHFTAPIVFDHSYSIKESLFLLEHEPDEFIRWDLYQKVKETMILEYYYSQDKGAFDQDNPLVKATEHLLINSKKMPAFTALCLDFPSEKNLSQAVEVLFPERIAAALHRTIKSLALIFQNQFLELYLLLQQQNKNEISNQMMAKRKLKNTLLYLLNTLETKEYHQLAAKQYHSSQNMTDRYYALQALNQNDHDLREDCMQDYLRNWGDNQQVYQKWLSLQARFQVERALVEIKKIERSSAFKITNPNHVRSLYGSFASVNFAQFHQLDQSGYDFILEKIKELNKINPQMSAYLTKQFASSTKIEPERKSVLFQKLKKLQQLQGLNENTKEVLTTIIG